jgi:hypothetical protein
VATLKDRHLWPAPMYSICSWPMGDYKILCGRLISEKVAIETYINIRPGPYSLYSAVAYPQSNFYKVDTLKKLAQTADEFSPGLGQRVKAFLFQSNCSFKSVDWKNFKYSSSSYLWPKASPKMLF